MHVRPRRQQVKKSSERSGKKVLLRIDVQRCFGAVHGNHEQREIGHVFRSQIPFQLHHEDKGTLGREVFPIIQRRWASVFPGRSSTSACARSLPNTGVDTASSRGCLDGREPRPHVFYRNDRIQQEYDRTCLGSCAVDWRRRKCQGGRADSCRQTASSKKV